jgi:uncharacterized protein YPO0396
MARGRHKKYATDEERIATRKEQNRINQKNCRLRKSLLIDKQEITGYLKQYILTTKINDVEVDVVCRTNSVKKFAELLDKPYFYVSDKTIRLSYIINECFNDPHVLFIKSGCGDNYIKLMS